MAMSKAKFTIAVAVVLLPLLCVAVMVVKIGAGARPREAKEIPFDQGWRALTAFAGQELTAPAKDGAAAADTNGDTVNTLLTFTTSKAEFEALASALKMTRQDTIEVAYLVEAEVRVEMAAYPAFAGWEKEKAYAFGMAADKSRAVFLVAAEGTGDSVEVFVRVEEAKKGEGIGLLPEMPEGALVKPTEGGGGRRPRGGELKGVDKPAEQI